MIFIFTFYVPMLTIHILFMPNFKIIIISELASKSQAHIHSYSKHWSYGRACRTSIVLFRKKGDSYLFFL